MLYYFNVYSYQSEFQAVEPMHPPIDLYMYKSLSKKFQWRYSAKLCGILFFIDWRGYNFDFLCFESVINRFFISLWIEPYALPPGCASHCLCGY